MSTRTARPRRQRLMLVLGLAVILLVVAVLVAESVVRTQLAARATAMVDGVEGATLGPGPTPALWQLATGRADLRLALDEAALTNLAACRTERDGLRVEPTPAGLVVTDEITFRGMSLPVEVLVVARETGSGWELVADSVTAAGISVPPGRAASLLGRGGGDDGADATAALIEGLALPHSDLGVTGVEFTDDAMRLAMDVAIDPGGDRSGRGALGGLHDCLASPDQPD